jgi:hypothetical protein
MAEEKDPNPIEFQAELRRYRWAVPFVPFDVILADGDRVQIDDPERLAFASNLLVWADRKKGISIYRKNQVVGFEVHETAHQ